MEGVGPQHASVSDAVREGRESLGLVLLLCVKEIIKLLLLPAQ